MRKTILMTGLLPILTALLLGGCSDSGTKSEGSLTDEEFQLMDQIMNESMQEFNMETLRLALNLTDSVAAMGGSSKPLFSLHKTTSDVLNITDLSYSYNNNWHVYQVTAKVVSSEYGQTDSLVMTGVDSIRFQTDGTPMQYPVEDSTDEVNIRQHYDMDAYGSLGETFSFMHHASLDLTGAQFDLDIFDLDGATSDSVDVAFDDYEGITCDIFLNSNQTYNSVTFNGDLECPESGSASIIAIVDMACSDSTESFTANGTWTTDITFNGDSVSVVVESGDTRWTYDDICAGDL